MSHGQAPTSKQLNYLRALAERTGTTFVPPTDRRQASSEIERLRHLKRRNNDAEPTDEGCESVYSTAPAADEIAGWGASATWCTTRRHSGRPAEVSDGRTRSSEEDGQGSCWLGRYPDVKGVAREIIDVALSHGRLVIDRCVDGGHDPRLVGRLEPDEPPENARLLARMYLQDGRRGRCRAVTDADLAGSPGQGQESASAEAQWRAPLVAGIGMLLQIQCVIETDKRVLRWTTTTRPAARPQVLPLRQVFASLQSYEPAASMTRAAITAQAGDPSVSVAALRGELDRARNSPIVLNRALRERVERAIAGDGPSMSEIAIRCRRTKRDKRGNVSGETSWLARRIGQLPEAGNDRPTPWVHTDVLALISREGLGLSPREAEAPLDDH